MSTALRVANAVCETTMRATAMLIAAGVAESRITRSGLADVCWLNVDEAGACAIIPTWEGGDVEYEGPGTVTIDVLWTPFAHALGINA